MTEEIQLPGDIIQWGEDDLHNALHRKDIEIFQMRKQIDVLVSARNDYFMALSACQKHGTELQTLLTEERAKNTLLKLQKDSPAAAQQALTDATARAEAMIADQSPEEVDEATPLTPITDAPIRRGPRTYETGPADASTVVEQGGDKIPSLQSAAAEVDAIAEQHVIAPIPILRPREKQP